MISKKVYLLLHIYMLYNDFYALKKNTYTVEKSLNFNINIAF